MHTYILSYTHTNINIHIYISGTYKAKYHDICIFTCKHSYTHKNIYVHIYIHIHIYKSRTYEAKSHDICIHTYLHTHTKYIYIYICQALTRRSIDRPWLTRPHGRVVRRRQSLQRLPTWKASAALPRSCSIQINLYVYNIYVYIYTN